jgi:threonine-phosphate decarboxylase
MNLTHGGRLFEIAARRGWDWRTIADFSANINPLGPAPGVDAAIRHALDRIVHYPDAEPLRQALAQQWRLDPDCILLGNGATELIHFLAARWASASVTLLAPVFSEFHRAFPQARLVMDERELPDHGVTVVTRPLNPQGTFPAIEEWLRRTEHPVLVDESFIEFTRRPSLLAMLGQRPRLHVLRSLTKFQALPGLRVGGLAAHPGDVAEWRGLRDPWPVNCLAVAAAIAAIEDEDHAKRTVEIVEQERGYLMSSLAPFAQGLSGEANYLYARLAWPAAEFTAFLEDRRILIRDCAGWPGAPENSVRLAVRGREENDRLIAAWREFAHLLV